MKRSFSDKKNVSEVRAVKQTKTEDVITVDGGKFLDTGGGFLLDAEDNVKKDVCESTVPRPIGANDEIKCIRCDFMFSESYLWKTLDLAVCDLCRPSEELDLITKSAALNEYLLTEADLTGREPPLKFLSRPNPHNDRWGEMKLYLKSRVEARALEKWGSLQALEEALLEKESKRLKNTTKKRQKQIQNLRKAVRSSLFKYETAASHQHSFSSETYNSDDDNYTRKCDTCDFVETYEKM